MRKITKKAELNPTQEQVDDVEEEQQVDDNGKGFFACYLLTSLCPRFKGHTYIGFTVNPRRRIRQHNGEIRSGAFRTKKRRPWEMVFCIYGFPTNVSALQFEWAWQHPMESLAVRQAAATFKSFSGVANKIKLAYTMLNLSAWQSLNITVNYFSTKYSTLSASCPNLPMHMKVHVCPIDELPCYVKTGESSFGCQEDEGGFDDNEKYSSATTVRSIVKEKTMEVQSSSFDELPCLNRGEENAFEGFGSNSSKDEASDGVGFRGGTENRNSLDTVDHVFSDDLHDIRTETDEECNTRRPSLINISADYPSSPEDDHAQPFDFIALTNNNHAEFELRNRETLSSKDDKDKSIPPEIEVIDLLSPSPDCRVMFSRKKRRVTTVFPQIIDLT